MFFVKIIAPYLLLGSLTLCLAHCKPRQQNLSSEIKVVGGRDAKELEAQATVPVFIFDSDETCGGTFLDDRRLVTAAHCVVLDILDGKPSVASSTEPTKRIIATAVYVLPEFLKNLSAEEQAFADDRIDEGLKLQNETILNDIAVVVFPAGTAAKLGVRSFPKIIQSEFSSQSPIAIVSVAGTSHKRIGFNKLKSAEQHILKWQVPESEISEHNAATEKGDSGGALLDPKTGDIGGIVTRGKKDAGVFFQMHLSLKAPSFAKVWALATAPVVDLSDGSYHVEKDRRKQSLQCAPLIDPSKIRTQLHHQEDPLSDVKWRAMQSRCAKH